MGKAMGEHAAGRPAWIDVKCDEKGRGMIGAKPDALAFWIFAALGARPDDDLDDLYPGSGAVSRAWEQWRRQMPLSLGASRTMQRERAEAFDL